VGFKVALCVIIAVTGASATGCGFGYDGDLGPDHWKDVSEQCAGKHQSPINIDSKHVTRVVLPPLKFHGFFYTEGEAILTNNGHTAMMTTDSKTKPTISGGPLPEGEYEFAQLHFHWGDNDTHGSEDEIDGKTYPMELHMVFYKKEYLNSTAALDHPDGLCVLAILFELGDVHNNDFSAFEGVLPNITKPETEALFDTPPALYDLMPYDLIHYFTYNGSLTTPPCSEVVTWIDFKEPVKLSHAQFEYFRALKNEEQHSMSNNFRAIQELGDRIVLFNINYYEEFVYEYQNEIEQSDDPDWITDETPITN